MTFYLQLQKKGRRALNPTNKTDIKPIYLYEKRLKGQQNKTVKKAEERAFQI